MTNAGASDASMNAVWSGSARACHDLTLMYAELMWTAQLETCSELAHVGLDGLRQVSGEAALSEPVRVGPAANAYLALVGSISRMARIQRLYQEQIDKVLVPTE